MTFLDFLNRRHADDCVSGPYARYNPNMSWQISLLEANGGICKSHVTTINKKVIHVYAYVVVFYAPFSHTKVAYETELSGTPTAVFTEIQLIGQFLVLRHYHPYLK